MRPLAIALLLATVAAADELASAEREVTRAAERARASVVTVYTPKERDMDLTGVVVSSRGVILTLRGPLLGKDGRLPQRVKVRFPGKGRTAEAEPIDDDPLTNTVLLQVPKMSTRAILTRRAEDTRLGQWVMLIGNVFGAGQESTPTTGLGIISGIVGQGDKITEIHASTLVNPGSFGAPIVDVGGGLIGIVAFKVTPAGEQTIVTPFDRIRLRYRSKGGAGAAVFANAPRKRAEGKRVSDAFGLVMDSVARRARAAVVAVRASRIPADDTPAKPPEDGGKTGRRLPRRPPPPAPVKGKLPAYDRSSGLVVAAEGLIVCPLRVTGWPGPTRPLLVDLADGRSFSATVLGTDERTRLALIRIDARDLEVLPDAPPETIRTGRFVLAIGYPHGNPERGTPQVTFGVVSRTRALFNLHPAFQAVQTDAGVAGGNRGGALVDIDGRLLGVLLDVNDTDPRGYATRGRGSYLGNAGLGFAVPMRVIRSILPKLEQGKNMRLGFLGVSADVAEGGLKVLNVVAKNTKDEPTTAARAGLKVGDVLVSIGETKLLRREDLRAALALFSVGDKVRIVFLRDGKSQTIEVELGDR